jgi:undecaprenyl-diphosphatase
MALTLPFRERPRFSAELGFRMPLIKADVAMLKWSSFPSDHAVMYFALATILFFVSRRIGLFAYFHATFVVCLPLLYLGIHYPTDIICGALIGIGIASLALIDPVREGIAGPAREWRTASPSTFYPALYLWTLLTATQFDPVRDMAVGFWTILKRKL